MAQSKSIIVLICIIITVNQACSSEILEKVKGGFNVVYDGVHCGFHKLKELVKHHEHDIDPCTGKSTVTTTPPSGDFNTENYQFQERRGDNDGTQQPAYGWRV